MRSDREGLQRAEVIGLVYGIECPTTKDIHLSPGHRALLLLDGIYLVIHWAIPSSARTEQQGPGHQDRPSLLSAAYTRTCRAAAAVAAAAAAAAGATVIVHSVCRYVDKDHPHTHVPPPHTHTHTQMQCIYLNVHAASDKGMHITMFNLPTRNSSRK